MYFLGYLAVPILIGCLAQLWKGRTGALWGFLTLLLMTLIWMLTAASGVQTTREIDYASLEVRQLVNMLTVTSITLVIMGLVVATLPTRKEPKTSS